MFSSLCSLSPICPVSEGGCTHRDWWQRRQVSRLSLENCRAWPLAFGAGALVWFLVAVDERESPEVLSILKWMQLIQPLGILGVPAGAFPRSLVVGFALWLSSWVCFFFEEAPSPHLSLKHNPQEVMCGLACPLLAKPLGDRPFTDGPLSTPSPSVTALGSAAVWQILLHLPPSPDCGPPWGRGKVFSPEVPSTQRGASTQERCLVNSHWIN